METTSNITPSNAKQIFSRIQNMLLSDNGHFGHVSSWGLSKEKHLNIGYTVSDQMLSVIEGMPAEERMRLGRMITYFEMHMRPLKHVIEAEEDSIGEIFAQWAWSHFAILIMFGLAEMAVRHSEGLADGKSLNNKGEKIKLFFNTHLSTDEKDSITKRYRQNDRKQGTLIITTFDDVMDDMWKRIRSGFVHEGAIESTPMEGTTFTNGGKKDDGMVIELTSDVAVHEWLKITWQAIFHLFGYADSIKEEHLKKNKRITLFGK